MTGPEVESRNNIADWYKYLVSIVPKSPHQPFVYHLEYHLEYRITHQSLDITKYLNNRTYQDPQKCLIS